MGRVLLIAALAACSPAQSDPAPTRDGTFSKAAFAEHIAKVKEQLKAKKLDLNVRIEDPFVVIGDGTPAALERSSGTVRWAADHLEKDFFAKRPTKILDIYLFTTAASYERGVKTLTGESPTTPYGFYSSTHGAMFMNIATGGGTLVHEIVHPYVEADFPEAPSWLNEGLGSLFEQSAEREGHIVGLTNWRLAGLQKTIKRSTLQSISTLAHLSHSAFYADDSGTNYAQARYLLYYMQEKGLLRDFYRAFRTARAKDPSGYATLVSTLGERDMDDFKKRWERYVAKLEFP
jgi:Protein of unknown function (DUF1570)